MPLAGMRSKSTATTSIRSAEAIEAAHQEKERPTVIIASTIKGKGVDFMENQAGWHYGGLDEAMQDQALEVPQEGINSHGKGTDLDHR